MKRKPATDALELRLAAAATPERVAFAAQMFADALDRLGVSAERGAITMVVDNFDMRATLRTRSKAAQGTVNQMIRLVTNPLRAVQRSPATGLIADVFAEYSPQLAHDGAEFWKPRGRKPIATVDDKFGDLMEGAARAARETPDVMRGTAVLHSPVFRIGRIDEGKRYTARVRVDGRPREVYVDPALVPSLFDAAKHGRQIAMKVTTTWLRHGDRFEFDSKHTCITAIDESPTSTGADVVAALQAALPSLADDARLAQFIEDLSGD